MFITTYFDNSQQDLIFPYTLNKHGIEKCIQDPDYLLNFFDGRPHSIPDLQLSFLNSLTQNSQITTFSILLDKMNLENQNEKFVLSDSNFFSRVLFSAFNKQNNNDIVNKLRTSFNWRYNFKNISKFYTEFFLFDQDVHNRNLENGYICFDITPDFNHYFNEENFELKCISYLKRNLIATFNDKKVYSLISKTSYDNYIKDMVFPEVFDYSEINPTKNIINFASLRSTYQANLSAYSKEILINFDFVFENNLFQEKLESLDQTKIDVIKVPSFSSISKDNLIEKTSYTKNQVVKRNTSFIPSFTKINVLGLNFEIEEIYLLNFFSLYSHSNLSSRKRSAKRFFEFYNFLVEEDSLQIFNKDLYIDRMKQKFKSLFIYSSDFLNNLTDSQKEYIVSLNLKNNYNHFDENLNSLILSSPKIDKKLDSKYKKLKEKTNKSILFMNDRSSLINNLLYTSAEIKKLKKELVKLTQDLEEKLAQQKTYFQRFSTEASSLFTNYNLFLTIKDKYFNEYASATQYTVDQFLNNYSNQGINIIDLNYTYQDNTYSINFKSSQQDVAKFLLAKKEGALQIESITFSTSTPTKINIVGNQDSNVYGGPYVVKVTKNSINISLKDTTSIFGSNLSTGACFVHPHSGATSSIDNLYYPNYSRACLGEASPLLYKAFEDNDIKLILISAMTWVSSANSADTWGKNYIYFPKKLDMIQQESNSVSLSDISEEEVIDFLSVFSDEDEDEDEDDSQLNQNEPTDTVEQQPVQETQETVYTRYTANTL